MSLRHAMLGILTAEDMTGYAFARAFDDSVGSVWFAPHSQIYRELRRMEEEGLIDGEEIERGSATKRRYSITEQGRAELEEWLQSPLAFPPERDAHRLQATYFEMVPGASAQSRFEAHARHWEQRLAQWEERRDAILSRRMEVLGRRLDHHDAEEHDAIIAYKAHSLEGQIARARAEIAWARKGRALVRQLDRSRSGA